MSLFLIGFAFVYYGISSLTKVGVRVTDIQFNHLFASAAPSDSTSIAGGRD
jgi:hypothetical protein